MEFNNFLLEKCWFNYGNFYESREDFNKHYESGEVKMPIPDIEKLYEEFLNTNPALPSRFIHGDEVILDFKEAGKLNNAKIIKVHFTERKVLYDVQIKTGNGLTRIYNIDSSFIEPKE